MADEKPPDAIDLSAWVDGVDVRRDDVLEGLGPITGTFSGVWDPAGVAPRQIVCVVCRQGFVPGPEGTALLTETESGATVGPVCPSCGVTLTDP